MLLRSDGFLLNHPKDLVRLRMLTRTGGWFQDADVLHLRAPPEPREDRNYHFFAALKARPGRRGHGLNRFGEAGNNVLDVNRN